MTSEKTAANARRDTDTDVMRVIASFFVVLLHSSGVGTATDIFCASVSRFSVPVFVIISGYYMLARKTPADRLAKKCLRLFLLMLVWSAIYYVYALLAGDRTWSGVGKLAEYLLTEPVHLWYLYAAIGLFLFTPVFYVFCKNSTRREYVYALALAFIFGSAAVTLMKTGKAPVLGIVMDKMKIAYTLGFVFLYLFGGYVRRFGVGKRARYAFFVFGILGTAVTVAGAFVSVSRGGLDETVVSFYAPNVILASAAFFLLVHCLPFKKNGKRTAAVSELSRCTLGIYLLHPLFILIMQRSEQLYWHFAPAPLLVPLRAVAAYALSALVVFCARKIPVVKALF